MNTFVQRFSGKIKGIISGFDRIVFKGCLRPLMFPDGAMAFFRSRGVLNKNDAQAGFPQLRQKYSYCKHLYFYYDHADYGFLSVRLQTWFPYSIQIALNGREWLRRALTKQKIPFVLHGHKFLPKLYNEHNALRVEMTMNNPAMFRIFRRPEGSKCSAPKKRLPLRKGMADIAVRAQVANDVNRRFMEQMATLSDDRPMRDILNGLSQPSFQNGRRVRALDILGKDRELLQALADPQYAVAGLSHKQLRQKLHASPWAKGGTDKQLSARICR